MTHKFQPGDELMFEDHRSRFSRPIPVVVHELLGAPDGCYTVKPLPALHNGPKITAFEDELWRKSK